MNPYEEIESLVSNARTLNEAAYALERLLSSGYSVLPDGRLYTIKVLVDRIKGLRIEVHPKEHAPPHFHVVGDRFDASFSLSDCSLLAGSMGGREQALVRWWFGRSKQALVKAWNESRPDDCQVGPVAE